MAALVAAGLMAAGCTSVQTLQIPTPPRADAGGSTTTTEAVLPRLAEQPVTGGTRSTSVAVGPGSAGINGTVFGPTGPVEGATVEAQRFVDDAAATTEATTAADGSFDIPGIRGGRYVVRAWRAPSLAETGTQNFFLPDGGTHTLNLNLTSYAGLNVATDLNPSAPFTGQPVNLAVEVTQPTVGPNGDVTQVPQVSVTVRLESTSFVPTGGGPAIATTGLDGKAVLGITCTQSGPAPITLLVGGSTTVSVTTPTCLASETTSTTATTVAPSITAPPSVPTPGAATTTGPPTSVPTNPAQGGNPAPTPTASGSPTTTVAPATTAQPNTGPPTSTITGG